MFYFVTQHFDGKRRHECVQPETLLVITSNIRVGPDLDIPNLNQCVKVNIPKEVMNRQHGVI